MSNEYESLFITKFPTSKKYYLEGGGGGVEYFRKHLGVYLGSRLNFSKHITQRILRKTSQLPLKG